MGRGRWRSGEIGDWGRVELPKADRLATAGKLPGKAALAMSALNIWITYFQHGQEEEIMSQIAV